MYGTTLLNIWYYKVMLKTCTVLFIDKVIRRYVIHFFSGYSTIRHYGFYPKRMIRHYVIDPTMLTLKCISPSRRTWAKSPS